jgi:hypothetical protein
MIGPLGGGFRMRMIYLLHGVFCIAPSFLYRTRRLVDNPLVGQLFVAHRLTDALLNLSHRLIEFSGYLVLIHISSSFLE